MKGLPLAFILSLPLAACGQAGDKQAATMSSPLELPSGQQLRVEVNRGQVVVEPSGAEAPSYEVRFKKDQSLMVYLGLRKDPQGGACPDCTASYERSKGLRVQSPEGVNAIVKVRVPAEQALAVGLEVGTVKIGALTGRIDAEVGVGTLDYDASALPKGACVDASVKTGATHNNRETGCTSVTAKLMTRTGTVTVD